MIVLSSYGLCSPIIAEKAKEYIKNPEELTVLLIPFAGFSNERTAEREINKGLIPFGFKLENIYICDVENPTEHMEKHIDIIYVSGGNPFKLLTEAYNCKGLTEWLIKLIKSGTMYWGISSGADFLTTDMEYLKQVDDCDYDIETYKGLCIVKEKILCHVDQRDMATLQKVKDCDERKTIFLRNDEIYIYNGGNER